MKVIGKIGRFQDGGNQQEDAGMREPGRYWRGNGVIEQYFGKSPGLLGGSYQSATPAYGALTDQNYRDDDTFLVRGLQHWWGDALAGTKGEHRDYDWEPEEYDAVDHFYSTYQPTNYNYKEDGMAYYDEVPEDYTYRDYLGDLYAEKQYYKLPREEREDINFRDYLSRNSDSLREKRGSFSLPEGAFWLGGDPYAEGADPNDANGFYYYVPSEGKVRSVLGGSVGNFVKGQFTAPDGTVYLNGGRLLPRPKGKLRW